jgi:N-acetylated-alpha-linked acidic dipeptidase
MGDARQPYDGWVFGAADPLSGHIALMGEAKAIGALAAQGWRPKRTLVYLSWDAEEPMLLGSTEWAETHADELKQKGIVYVNSDGNGRGFMYALGSHSLQHLVNAVAADVADPETGASVGARARAAMGVAANNPGADEDDKENAKIAADPSKDFPILPLGSGSDYSPFLQHLVWRRSISVSAAKAKSAAFIIRPMIPMNITAASPIRVSNMRPCWLRRRVA